MKLYLMQHALAYPSEENSERPLSPAGIAQSKSAASGVKKLGISFDLIITSPKRRAQQTAALIAEGVRYPYSDILATEAVLPKASAQEVLELLSAETAEQVLIVGHMPHLAVLAEQLLSGAQLVFENAGLTCLELNQQNSARLLFHLTTNQLGN